MDIIRYSIEKPVTVISVIIIVLLFGLISLKRLPFQLSPTVIEPEIKVTTTWRGATPYEIEREIIEEQENTLKGLPNLEEMESESMNGMGTVTLRFKVGTNVEEVLTRVSNKLNEVPSYPNDVDKPVVNASGASTSPVVWIILKTMDSNPRHVETYRTFFEEEVRQHLERVKGVSDLFIGAGTEQEMHVVVKPDRLAALGLTVYDLISNLQNENINISAGTLEVGRQKYRIRTKAEFNSAEDIRNVVLRSDGQKRVLLRDVADVDFGYAKPNGVVLHNGTGGMAVGIRPEPGTNILEMTDQLEETVKWLNETKLKPNKLYFHWLYDQRFYIGGAIKLIKQNIVFGGLLAVAVLMLFLRSLRATAVVALAIPISIVGTFTVLDIMGRNLNVISLAGIAFAVGMLVDNAIVVIENIDRHRKTGKSAYDAALDGTKEVWGAVLASTVTTVAVFLPIVFIHEEAGQLFRDIAIAVVTAVSLSLFVSVSVIPMFSNKFFGVASSKKLHSKSILVSSGNWLAEQIMNLVSMAIRNWKTRLTTICLLTGLAFFTVWALLPKMEYLPQGNRNFVLSILAPPPGLSNQELLEIGNYFTEIARPHLGKDVNGMPGIADMFYIGREGFNIVGALSTHWDRAGELRPLFNRMIYSIPGMYGVSLQPGIFSRRIGTGRSVELDISGDDLELIVAAATRLFEKIRDDIDDTQVRPVPSIELSYPEAQIIPDRERLKTNGMTSRELGLALDVLMDGTYVGDFKQEGKKKIDLIIKSADAGIATPEDLYHSLLSTPKGQMVPVSSLARLEHTAGMTQIRHLERKRTVTLQITPPDDMALQEALEIIEQEIIPAVRAEGLFKELEVGISGAADKLIETRNVLQWNFVLAALIAYLLMASLFSNFIYPLIIMLTIPLAGAGGFIGLKLLNIFLVQQPMDVLTMLGFVILIGVVVNNAILIVHQALNNFHNRGMTHHDAVLDSTRSRLRPIYMSATTSIFGMMPLVLVQGAGSEMYRGLGSVLLGGLAVSTVCTVFVIPAILMFVIPMEKRREHKSEKT
ncbi:MAG TPA: efflux RND transporter permease subunit [Desulfobulbales bacterium]|jgi:HAE1 family hydrophobic/amphiphilic exporter-1|nr:efflux RND transporter permease subunit [Desulfobulbales bacterium]